VLTSSLLIADIATAEVAVRNLNGYDIGTRQLRVDFSEKEGSGKTQTTSEVSNSHFIAYP
jgi:cleavage stimulation factor subunit 2